VVIDRNGRDQKFGGVGTGSNQWYIPAISSGKYFLKIAPTTIAANPFPKKTIAITVHESKNAGRPVAGTPTFTGLPEYEGIVDAFGNLGFDQVYDQHFFLVPEAKLLVILTGSKDKLILRKVDLPN
jgi:hypothetical protein